MKVTINEKQNTHKPTTMVCWLVDIRCPVSGGSWFGNTMGAYIVVPENSPPWLIFRVEANIPEQMCEFT